MVTNDKGPFIPDDDLKAMEAAVTLLGSEYLSEHERAKIVDSIYKMGQAQGALNLLQEQKEQRERVHGSNAESGQGRVGGSVEGGTFSELDKGGAG